MSCLFLFYKSFRVDFVYHKVNLRVLLGHFMISCGLFFVVDISLFLVHRLCVIWSKRLCSLVFFSSVFVYLPFVPGLSLFYVSPCRRWRSGGSTYFFRPPPTFLVTFHLYVSDFGLRTFKPNRTKKVRGRFSERLDD